MSQKLSGSVHATVPHTQGPTLAVVSVLGHAGAEKDPTVMCDPLILLHEFLDASQKSPVSVVQPVVPHVHASEFTKDPLLLAHTE